MTVTPPLRLGGVPEHFNHPWQLALSSTDLADLTLHWTDQPGGTGQLLAGLESGELDVVSILTEGTVSAIDDGLAATIVQVYVDSPLQWGIHVPASSAVADVAQLDGARIAISRPRSGSHLMALVMADRLGWAVEPEQLVEVGGIDGARSSVDDDVWDVFLWDRYMTQPLVDAGTFRRVGVEPTPWPPFVIAVRNEVLHGRTAAVGRVIDAVMAEATRLHQRPGIRQELAKRYDLSYEDVDGWLDTTRFASRAAVDPVMLEDTRRHLAQVA